MTDLLRIANVQAFWGDRTDAAAWTLSLDPNIDYITLDYLAEVSMGIMAIQKQKETNAGYAKDFVDVIKSLIPYWQNGGQCRVITNAGGLNPVACAEACKEVLQAAGVQKAVTYVAGDDVVELLDQMDGLDVDHDKIVSANAYLGAAPIVEALQNGADIVITGRVADPSLTVAPCIHTFGWDHHDYNRIAQATVAGHLIECGTQVTGGISTNWLELVNFSDIGYPIIEIESSGEFIVTKSHDTGGKVSLETVKEQLVYEIGDPEKYLSPDATVSFLTLHLDEIAPNRVRVTGAKGKAPPDSYKVSVTYHDGYKAEGSLVLTGPYADTKAKRTAEVIFSRVTPERHEMEYYGTEKKGLLRIAVADHNKEILQAWSKEIAPMVTAGPQGTTGYTSGRPKIRPVFGFLSATIPSERISKLVKPIC